jgi:hypothetical protein
MLEWSVARVHRLDDILRPLRLVDGTRIYDIYRVLYFVRVAIDSAPSALPSDAATIECVGP